MLSKLMDNYDMTSFIVPFWKVLFVELNKETLDDELSQEIFGTLVETMDVNRLGGEQVRSALTATFGLYNNKLDNQSIDDNNGTDSKPRIPKSFRKNIRTMAIRHDFKTRNKIPIFFKGSQMSSIKSEMIGLCKINKLYHI